MCLRDVVVVGGHLSNGDAACLSEYFLATGTATRVVGVPGTIDGDLRTRTFAVLLLLCTPIRIVCACA